MSLNANDHEATSAACDIAKEIDELKELKKRTWTTGKDAVSDIKAYALSRGNCTSVSKMRGGTFKRMECSSGEKCTWFIKLSVTNRKLRDNYWHVTTGNLAHIKCTGTAKPSAQQLAQTSVLSFPTPTYQLQQ
ncbi:hypothetical protein F441_10616 [Phytophthora nicotianae CJ01A1]|uniref:Transposase MuDR plant domain-containing protein n=5 Tax=Phytophthora nicotianae TaxID=4792 RepID=V9F1J4_PHYNI|nr:hypothetical protein F443_10669 [Phytophthora nicotianae P1569]ETM44484.1 hypothetical protein L914_10292 [Phytophthora nicotianae]ETO73268.1 hypothetical protein F444_10775 [Phytophthora nicotianae P1976]ETP14453.1 hypothetical protein F441_10616 [Phytophthora nicotianae CJ01A1]ETP42527.1 hypothetical protein F442_10575 [Phytophthora nicotianae P10297]